MSIDNSTHHLWALHAQARRRAQELRREAMDDFWRGANAVWTQGVDSARRSAQRLSLSLARHARLRQERRTHFEA